MLRIYTTTSRSSAYRTFLMIVLTPIFLLGFLLTMGMLLAINLLLILMGTIMGKAGQISPSTIPFLKRLWMRIRTLHTKNEKHVVEEGVFEGEILPPLDKNR